MGFLNKKIQNWTVNVKKGLNWPIFSGHQGQNPGLVMLMPTNDGLIPPFRHIYTY